jgi:hypothetical protein
MAFRPLYLVSTVSLCLALGVGVLWITGVLPSVAGQVLFPLTVFAGIAAGLVDDRIH